MRRALVGPQENFVLGGHHLPPALLFGQEILETRGCKGESLPTEAHQVGILKPGVIEAVLNGGTGPVEDQTRRILEKCTCCGNGTVLWSCFA